MLDNMHARTYNPATSTFTNPDPLALVTSQPYLYADGDPIAQTAPTGAISCPTWIPGCGVITDIQSGISSAAQAWWHEWWSDNPCSPGYSAASLTPYELAQAVAEAAGSSVGEASGAGYKVLIPYGKRGIMVRVMQVTGDYPSGYWRISVPGKQAFTIEGEPSGDLALTHIDIGDSSLEDIRAFVGRIAGE